MHDDTKMGKGRSCNHLAYDNIQWWILIYTVTNFRYHKLYLEYILEYSLLRNGVGYIWLRLQKIDYVIGKR
jgi:hypothetical protein